MLGNPFFMCAPGRAHLLGGATRQICLSQVLYTPVRGKC
jgi:hypothetical protein